MLFVQPGHQDLRRLFGMSDAPMLGADGAADRRLQDIAVAIETMPFSAIATIPMLIAFVIGQRRILRCNHSAVSRSAQILGWEEAKAPRIS